MRVIHLPFYPENPYQALLMAAQRAAGLETVEGGGGGNFLRSALFRWKADVIHFHWLHPYLIRPGWFATIARSIRFLAELTLLRLCGKRLIWTMHNQANHDERHPGTERFFRRLALLLFHGVHVHSAFAHSLIQPTLGKYNRIVVYPHPTYRDAYPNTINRSTARTELGLSEDDRVVLFLGRIMPYKGIVPLVEAIRAVACRNLKLVIAGIVGCPQEWKAIVAAAGNCQQIRLCPGYVADDKVQVYLNAADVVAFPFREILTSGSMVLAMGFSRPVIVPSSAGLRESLPDAYPLVTKSGRKEELEDILKAVADGTVDLNEIGRTCKEWVDQFTWTEFATRLLELYAGKTTQVQHAGHRTP